MKTTANPFKERGFGAPSPWIDLANSDIWDGYGNHADLLDDPRWVSGFLNYWNFTVAPPDANTARELHRLRSFLRDVVKSSKQQSSLSSAALESLNRWLKVPVYRQLVEHQNGLVLTHAPVQFGWPMVIATIAASFADSLTSGKLDRLKFCANEGCRWVFVDRTKGNVRRWCNDATCGNRDRVRRSRAANRRIK